MCVLNGQTRLASQWETMCGREEEISILEAALKEPCQEESDLYYFHGESGVGKSKLCGYVRTLCQTSSEEGSKKRGPYLLHLDVVKESDELYTVRKFYEKLTAFGPQFTFPRYEAANCYLHKLTDNTEYHMDLEKKFDEQAGKLLRVTVSFASTILESLQVNLPIGRMGETVEGHLQQKLGERLHREWEETLRAQLEPLIQKWDRLMEKNIRPRLIEYFVEDLNESLAEIAAFREEEHHLIITLDAFEKRPRSGGKDWFLEKLIPNMKKTLWFVFGTDEEIPSMKDLCGSFHPRRVELLPDDKLRTYLFDNGIAQKEDQDFIIEKSRGLPASVQILLMIYHDNHGKFNEKSETDSFVKLFEDYFEERLEGNVTKGLISYLSLFDHWNMEVVHHFYQGNSFSEAFQELIQTTALVEQSHSAGEEENSYHLVDIVRKTVLTILSRKKEKVDWLIANSYKYRYEKQKTDRLMERWKSEPMGYEGYTQLGFHCREAFRAAVESYSSQEDFEDIAEWCLKAQSFMDRKGFFEMEAELSDLFLEKVDKRDHFRYDTPDDERLMFRFRTMTNRAWAHRNIGDREKATVFAKECYQEVLGAMGPDFPYTAFAFYRYGLTFRDSCDYETAERLFLECLSISEGDTKLIGGLKSPLSSVVNNVLGCIMIDQKKYEEAEKFLLVSQRQRRSEDKVGLRTAHSNLSKLYFQWAQHLGADDPKDPRIGEYLKKAEEEMELGKAELQAGGVTISRRDESKEVTLKLARDRMKYYAEKGAGWRAPDWQRELRVLEQNVAALEKMRSKDSLADIMAVRNNIAVIYALQGKYSEAERRLSQCMEQKNYFYGVKQNPHMKKKPAVRDTAENLKAIRWYVENPHRMVRPYEFILLY